jgi:FtsZ-interacting cell division protein ZipA
VPELRWILLGAGIALILGLWWWETRRPRDTRAAAPEETWRPEDAAPGAASNEDAAADDFAEPDEESAAAYAPTIERVRVERRPPLIEIPEDMEVDVSDFVGIERRHAPEPEFTLAAQPDNENEFRDDGTEDAPVEVEFDESDDHHRAPWVRTQPLERDEIAPRREEEPPEPPTDALERRTAEASQQRIVALRLVAHGDHWPGAEVRAAFEAENLEFGPYSIFHLPREDGKSLFYVASLMEPGSFDPERMDEQEFSGISLFGVIPGPLDAPATFDLVLSVGRNLADRLKGQLQDEQGSTLTAQRILNLREELVHFEHRNRRLRRS